MPGVTFNRLRKRWMVSIKTAEPWPKRWKYVGAFKSLKAALAYWKTFMEAPAA